MDAKWVWLITLLSILWPYSAFRKRVARRGPNVFAGRFLFWDRIEMWLRRSGLATSRPVVRGFVIGIFYGIALGASLAMGSVVLIVAVVSLTEDKSGLGGLVMLAIIASMPWARLFMDIFGGGDAGTISAVGIGLAINYLLLLVVYGLIFAAAEVWQCRKLQIGK